MNSPKIAENDLRLAIDAYAVVAYSVTLTVLTQVLKVQQDEPWFHIVAENITSAVSSLLQRLETSP